MIQEPRRRFLYDNYQVGECLHPLVAKKEQVRLLHERKNPQLVEIYNRALFVPDFMFTVLGCVH